MLVQISTSTSNLYSMSTFERKFT